MRIAHHLMMPPPPRPELDAVAQEAGLLAGRFGGEVGFVYPAARHRRWIPRLLYGATQLRQLRAQDRRVDAHQVYSNGLFVYPALAGLGKPIVYCLTTPLEGRPRRRLAAGVAAFVTPIDRDAAVLRGLGAPRVAVVRPGIDLERFKGCPPPPALAGGGLTLVAGSAPWTARQFRTKGVLALLEAAAARPRVRLVLLWRGVLAERIRAEVARRGLGERVDVVDRRVAVEEVLGRADAAVVLTTSPRLVKAYPHSLLEALAAGRPVLVSPGIELAGMVGAAGAGELVHEVSAAAVITALDRLRADYAERQRAALAIDLGEFSRERFLERYEALYRELVAIPLSARAGDR